MKIDLYENKRDKSKFVPFKDTIITLKKIILHGVIYQKQLKISGIKFKPNSLSVYYNTLKKATCI